jgi:hypothetical protein
MGGPSVMIRSRHIASYFPSPYEFFLDDVTSKTSGRDRVAVGPVGSY